MTVKILFIGFLVAAIIGAILTVLIAFFLILFIGYLQIKDSIDEISDIVTEWWEAIQEWWEGSFLKKFLDDVQSEGGWFDWICSAISRLIGSIKDWWNNCALKKWIDGVLDWWDSFDLIDFLKKAWDKTKDFGKQLVNKLIDGIAAWAVPIPQEISYKAGTKSPSPWGSPLNFAKYWSDIFDSDKWTVRTRPWHPFEFLKSYKFDIPDDTGAHPEVEETPLPEQPEPVSEKLQEAIEEINTDSMRQAAAKGTGLAGLFPSLTAKLADMIDGFKKQNQEKEQVPVVVAPASNSGGSMILYR